MVKELDVSGGVSWAFFHSKHYFACWDREKVKAGILRGLSGVSTDLFLPRKVPKVARHKEKPTYEIGDEV